MSDTDTAYTDYFDITAELLGVIGRLALTILTSAHSAGQESGGALNVTSRNLFWIGDVLHNLGQTSVLLTGRRYDAAVESLERQIDDIRDYLDTQPDASYGVVAKEVLKPLEAIHSQLSRKL